jgi:hypothetical protein
MKWYYGIFKKIQLLSPLLELTQNDKLEKKEIFKTLWVGIKSDKLLVCQMMFLGLRVLGFRIPT